MFCRMQENRGTGGKEEGRNGLRVAGYREGMKGHVMIFGVGRISGRQLGTEEGVW